MTIKKILLTVFIGFLLNVSVSPASAKDTVSSSYSMNRLAESVCVQVAGNQPIKLRRLLRDAKLSLSSAYASIRCNGANMADYARFNHANEILDFVQHKLNLAVTESEIQTPVLVAEQESIEAAN